MIDISHQPAVDFLLTHISLVHPIVTISHIKKEFGTKEVPNSIFFVLDTNGAVVEWALIR